MCIRDRIKDVAAMAGVSISTVSRALSGKTYVEEETKARVLDAVETVSYTHLDVYKRQAESPQIALVSHKHGEVAKYYANDEHQIIPDMVVASTDPVSYTHLSSRRRRAPISPWAIRATAGKRM